MCTWLTIRLLVSLLMRMLSTPQNIFTILKGYSWESPFSDAYTSILLTNDIEISDLLRLNVPLRIGFHQESLQS